MTTPRNMPTFKNQQAIEPNPVLGSSPGGVAAAASSGSHFVSRRRAYQNEALRAIGAKRLFAMLWLRQGGKSTLLSEAALKDMMQNRGRTVTYASASLLLGREIILKEAAVFQDAVRAMMQLATGAQLRLDVQNSETHKSLLQVSLDDWAEVYEHQKLAFYLWHDRTTFSRTQVIAPNAATARGWTGTVFIDEFGFIQDFRLLMEAVEPIVSSNPDFRLVMATTIPKDDGHYSYELCAPPIGTEFEPNPSGNWYESEAGIPVHRVDINDAYLAGKKTFDLKTGSELTPEVAFRRAPDKDAFRRNYRLEWVLGGTTACGRVQLHTAQSRGVGQCAFFEIDSDADMVTAMAWLASAVHPDRAIGLGLDVATTEKSSSNPSSISITERDGPDRVVRATLIWKTRDPDVARSRIAAVLDVLESRPGRQARALCVDATSEKYFAEDVRKRFSPRLPVRLVVASENVDARRNPPVNWKTYLGDNLVGALDDNHLILPPEAYISEDFRLVKKDRGLYVCVPDDQGRHGDTFDSTKLSIEALNGSGPVYFEVPQAEEGERRGRRWSV